MAPFFCMRGARSGVIAGLESGGAGWLRVSEEGVLLLWMLRLTLMEVRTEGSGQLDEVALIALTLNSKALVFF